MWSVIVNYLNYLNKNYDQIMKTYKFIAININKLNNIQPIKEFLIKT